MQAMLAGMAKGRRAVRRRIVTASAILLTLVTSFGAWRISAGNRFVCVIPTDRVRSAWTGESGDSRRAELQAAWSKTSLPDRQKSWQRFSATLDAYIEDWRAAYLEACEATHLRGEQSFQTLDLRMTCLGESLDQLRALTNALLESESDPLRAISAAKDLTPVSHCSDITLLRSSVPLPRDERTFRKVKQLRESLREAKALSDVGSFQRALTKALPLVSEARATGYKPLIAQALFMVGLVYASLDRAKAEPVLEEAMFTAEAGRDDETAATAAESLGFVVGHHLGRPREGERWMNLTRAIVERLGPGHERLRSWLLQDTAAIRWIEGDLEGAYTLTTQAVAAKRSALGSAHPDVGISLTNLGLIAGELGRFDEALSVLQEGLDILSAYADPDSPWLANALANQGTVLLAARRYDDARRSFERALELSEANDVPRHSQLYLADALEGLAEIGLVEKRYTDAVDLLEEALRIRQQHRSHPILLASTRFALARAIVGVGGDRSRAFRLAEEARNAYVANGRPQRADNVAAWQRAHRRIPRGGAL